MTLSRWAKAYGIIDYTPNSKPEEDFVRRWIFDHRELLHNVQTNDRTFTFKAINVVIGEFNRALDMFKEEDLHLQEMEVYFNEH